MSSIYYALNCFGKHIRPESEIKKLPKGKILADVQRSFNKTSKNTKIVGWQKADYSQGYWKCIEVDKDSFEKSQIEIDGILCDVVNQEVVKVSKHKEVIMYNCIPDRSLDIYAAITFGEMIQE